MDMTLSDLRRLTLAATDGNLGRVVNLCFDDRSWTIRYLVVDASSWFPNHWVLISPISVRSWAPDPSILRGALSKTQVRISTEAHIPHGGAERSPQPSALEHAIRDRGPSTGRGAPAGCDGDDRLHHADGRRYDRPRPGYPRRC
jgi:hypothetical protein